MTEQEMKEWIDNATYAELLLNWRFTRSGHPLFKGEMGEYFEARMSTEKYKIGPLAASRISKYVGWEN